MNDQSKGLLITALGVLFVVPDALFVRLIDAPTLTVTLWRNLLCGLVILAVMAAKHRSGLVHQIKRSGKSGVVYGICAATSSALFVYSVNTTSVANTVFIISSMPVFAALYSWVLLGEAPNRRMIWTIVLVITGLVIIGAGSLGHAQSNILGDIAALGVAAIFAMGLTAARRAKSQSMVPIASVAYIIGGLAFALFTDPFDVGAGSWPLIALHGGVFIAASTTLLAIGPRYITSPEVALLILGESVLAPLLVWFVLREQPNELALIGGALVIIVLFISNIIALRRRRVRASTM